LNLQTLAITQLAFGASEGRVGFTTPDGLAIVATVGTGAQVHLVRFSLTGTFELSYPTSFPGGGGPWGGSAVYSPDGTELALGLMSGIELVSNDGQALRYLPVNPSVESCTVRRWWTASELLVGCAPGGSSTLQLWLVPTSGATPTALTASPPASGDLGDLDAWRIPSGTYVQDAGACGYAYVAKLQPSGLTAWVSVPGVPGGDSTIVLGTHDDRIAIDAKPACSVGASLLWYAPATNSVTPILGGPVNGGTAESAVLFGQP
jgi:TolB protein